MELYSIFAAVVRKLTVTSAAAFVMTSAVAGLFAGIADTVQYFRYSRGFPETDFTMNLVAGIAAFLMLAFSAGTAVGLHRHCRKTVLGCMMVSTAAAFLMAFLPRPAVGSAVRLDLFIYLGGLGILATVLFRMSASSPDAPDNTP
jgi:cellobiose-specific phosphotransferase system component IIC